MDEKEIKASSEEKIYKLPVDKLYKALGTN